MYFKIYPEQEAQNNWYTKQINAFLLVKCFKNNPCWP